MDDVWPPAGLAAAATVRCCCAVSVASSDFFWLRDLFMETTRAWAWLRSVVIAALVRLAACWAPESCRAAAMNWCICADLVEESWTSMLARLSTVCGLAEVIRAAIDVRLPSS